MTSGPPDEFAWIDRLRPLTRGDPRALGLMDDAAVLPARNGYDLVISSDTMVEGVHWLAGEDPQIVAQRLLRVSLSDLAAKAAEPFGYFLDAAWPGRFDWSARDRFIAGLDEAGRRFGVVLLGGDTVATPGPSTFTATVLGWVPQGRVIRRGGARAGDVCAVIGTIGDGWLGLMAAKDEIPDSAGVLAGRYRLPEPLFGSRDWLRAHASAAADVSDGLVADAAHIAEASGLGLTLRLEELPLSPQVSAWLSGQPDEAAARLMLATGGDDYAIVCALKDEPGASDAGGSRIVGVFQSEPGLHVTCRGAALSVSRTGWRHSDA